MDFVFYLRLAGSAGEAVSQANGGGAMSWLGNAILRVVCFGVLRCLKAVAGCIFFLAWFAVFSYPCVCSAPGDWIFHDPAPCGQIITA